MREKLRADDTLPRTGVPLRYRTGRKQYLTRPTAARPDALALSRIVTQLQQEAAQAGYGIGLETGLVYLFGGELRRFIFTEICGEGKPCGHILRLPATVATGCRTAVSRIENAGEVFAEQFRAGGDLAVFESPIFSGVQELQSQAYALRCVPLDGSPFLFTPLR